MTERLHLERPDYEIVSICRRLKRGNLNRMKQILIRGSESVYLQAFLGCKGSFTYLVIFDSHH